MSTAEHSLNVPRLRTQDETRQSVAPAAVGTDSQGRVHPLYSLSSSPLNPTTAQQLTVDVDVTRGAIWDWERQAPGQWLQSLTSADEGLENGLGAYPSFFAGGRTGSIYSSTGIDLRHSMP